MKVQKAKHLKDELTKKNPDLAHEYMVFEKLDGWYGYADYDTETKTWGVIKSSAGREIPAVSHISLEALNFPKPDHNSRLIFELFMDNVPFHRLNGMLNRKSEQLEDIELRCHDLVNLDIAEPFKHRFDNLVSLVGQVELSAISVVELLAVVTKLDSHGLHNLYFDKITALGGEGVIMKQSNAPYQAGKRNSSLLKLKLSLTLDLKIVDSYISIGAKGNEAYNLILQRVNGTLITVVVAKHSDQEYIRNNNVLGMVAEIGGMKELEDGTVREPTFRCFRFDKTVEELND